MIQRNCRCAGCAKMAMPMSCYCDEHNDGSKEYPMYPQTHHTVGVTHEVKYGAKPENEHNKI